MFLYNNNLNIDEMCSNIYKEFNKDINNAILHTIREDDMFVFTSDWIKNNIYYDTDLHKLVISYNPNLINNDDIINKIDNGFKKCITQNEKHRYNPKIEKKDNSYHVCIAPLSRLIYGAIRT